jgi:hypothetical protein
MATALVLVTATITPGREAEVTRRDDDPRAESDTRLGAVIDRVRFAHEQVSP